MIYIGLPVRDEEHTAGVLLWRIRKLLVEEDREFHVVVVDDGSTDATPDVLEPYERVLPLTLFRNETPRGYADSVSRIARAVVTASDYTRRDALVLLQADFTETPEAIPAMVRRFEGGVDLVGGVPSPIRGESRQMTLARRAGRYLARRTGCPEVAGDLLTGYRLYRLFVLERALEVADDADEPLVSHDGWAGNVEMLARTLPHARQAEAVEFALDYTRRYRESRFRPLRELWELLRLSTELSLDLDEVPAVGREDRGREAS